MPGTRHELYPLTFREIIRDYGFGERWIVEEFEKVGLPERGRIAETWEVCDRPTESSQVTNGPLAGATLHELIADHGEALLGTRMAERFGTTFPLLIKLLDASQPLGEQVHQSDRLRRKWGLNDYFGKTEAWYMLRCRPGARVFCGARPGVTEERLRQALAQGTVRELMCAHEPRPGDPFLLYAGTMHYSPGGLLFYEIMQNSDVIVGLGRAPRDAAEAPRWADRAVEAVHLEEGFDCRTQPVTIEEGRSRRTFAVACNEFALERLDLAERWPVPADGRRFCVLTAIEGRAQVGAGGTVVALRTGQSCLVPACCADAAVVPDGRGSLLCGYVPDLAADVIGPLRAAGVPDEAICALGAHTKLNPIGELL